MENEILSDIRNKLQAFSVVLERMSEGLTVSESFLNLAIRDFIDAWKLFKSLSSDGKSLKDFII
jgi:hypothetical protein